MLIIGLDPGLRNTGWGIVRSERGLVEHIANGTVRSDAGVDMSVRLLQLHDGLQQVMGGYQPQAAAVEEIFANVNAKSSLSLALARGVVMLVPALSGIVVTSYSPNKVKKSVVGAGKASKDQVQIMVKRLLPGAAFESPDAADALAVAICHAHSYRMKREWNKLSKK